MTHLQGARFYCNCTGLRVRSGYQQRSCAPTGTRRTLVQDDACVAVICRANERFIACT